MVEHLREVCEVNVGTGPCLYRGRSLLAASGHSDGNITHNNVGVVER